MAGKGKRPEGGVNWGKQYERSPFLSPWEKKIAHLDDTDRSPRESNEEWAMRKKGIQIVPEVVPGSFRREDLQELSEYRESKGV